MFVCFLHYKQEKTLPKTVATQFRLKLQSVIFMTVHESGAAVCNECTLLTVEKERLCGLCNREKTVASIVRAVVSLPYGSPAYDWIRTHTLLDTEAKRKPR